MGFNFAQKTAEFKKMKRTLPVVIANMAVKHYRANFRLGGFVDQSLVKWKARSTKDKSDRSRRNRNNPRAILVKTGHLRNSIRARVADWRKIELGAYGVPYAVFHNKGMKPNPKRQFIGRSRKLEKAIRARINKEMTKVLNQ